MSQAKLDLNKYIVKVKNFPIPGVIFSDISKLIEDGDAFSQAVEELCKFSKKFKPTKIIGIESRGFIFGTPVANKLNVGFASVRKPNKLPRAHISAEANIEYGKRVLSIHRDSVNPGEKVIIIDDILATGGSIKAAIELMTLLKAEVMGICFLGRITSLDGEKIIKNYPHKWLLEL